VSVAQLLADVEPRMDWHNSAGPWCLVHVPTGEKVPTPRTLPDGTVYSGYAFKRKRDALRALAELREAA
jgi:hypothetical protein